jgi:RNA polymerase sigma-70 factor (ECF subfamily)
MPPFFILAGDPARLGRVIERLARVVPSFAGMLARFAEKFARAGKSIAIRTATSKFVAVVETDNLGAIRVTVGSGIDATSDDRQSIEWNIPDELAPTLEHEVFDDTANDSATLKFPGDVMGARLRIMAELSYRYATVIVVLDHAGSGSIQTNKTEAAQDALVRAYRALGGYDAGRIRELRLRPWLTTIVVNVCRNRTRVRRVRTTELGFEPGAEPAADPVARRDVRDAWASLLATLPPAQRIAIVLRHVDGLSYAEMAEALGKPEGTLKAQVHRGLATLRDALADERHDRKEMTA